MGPYWIVGAENGTFDPRTLTGEILQQKVNGFWLKLYIGPTPSNPFRNAAKLTGENASLVLAKSISGGGPTPH